MENNKWTLKVAHNYKVGDQEVTRTATIAIPPTAGERTDILTTLGYYCGITKKEFMARESKEDYLKRTQPELKDKPKEFKRVLAKMDWSPRLFDDDVDLVIEIKRGEITLR